MKQKNLELDLSQPQRAEPDATSPSQTEQAEIELQPSSGQRSTIGIKIFNWINKYHFTSSKTLFGSILFISVFSIVLGLFNHDQTSEYLKHSQKIRDVVATANSQQADASELQQHLQQVQSAIQSTLGHPLARSNFADLLKETGKQIDKANLLKERSQVNAQTQEFIIKTVHQIANSKANYRKAIEPTLQRMRSYKNEAKFEQLTANANQTDLFNALNYKQAEERLENLQLAADRLIQNYESLFYAQTKQELDTLIGSYPESVKHFNQVAHDFADIPTKMAVKNWYKNNIETLEEVSNLAPTLAARLNFSHDMEKLAERTRAIVEEAKLIERRLTVHLISQTQLQPTSSIALWLVIVLALIGMFKHQLINTLNKLLEKVQKQVEKTAK